MAFPSISHVAVTVKDLASSAAWYERLLGLFFKDPDGNALEFFAPPAQ